MYVCMYVCIYVCMYVCTYVCLPVAVSFCSSDNLTLCLSRLRKKKVNLDVKNILTMATTSMEIIRMKTVRDADQCRTGIDRQFDCWISSTDVKRSSQENDEEVMRMKDHEKSKQQIIGKQWLIELAPAHTVAGLSDWLRAWKAYGRNVWCEHLLFSFMSCGMLCQPARLLPYLLYLLIVYCSTHLRGQSGIYCNIFIGG